MTRNIDGRRIAVEAPPHHQDRLAVIVSFIALKCDIRRDRHVARHFLPDELKVVDTEPHVLAAAGHAIASGCLIKARGACVQDRANVSMTFKESDCLGI